MKHRKMAGLVLALILSFGLIPQTACKRNIHVTNLPSGVSEQQVLNWYTATGITAATAKTLNSATDAVLDLQSKGILTGSEFRIIRVAFIKIATAGLSTNMILEAAPQTFGKPQVAALEAFVNVATGELGNITKIANVKNPDSVQTITSLVAAVQAGIKTANILIKVFK